ncbi:DUF742 domain-containing protein [Streptomyces sp. NPDC005706]|uniref:DUF742 domain-containing protein n=1 Tax=Streptomyces sp. NPDC005706 TaxID=3157169 RepID=UPI0033D9B642
MDDERQHLRPYALTGGRTRPSHTLERHWLIKARNTVPRTVLSPEGDLVLKLCRSEPLSVAEVAARLCQPLQVAKVMLGDLIDDGVLITAMSVDTSADASDPELLRKLLAGLRALI